MQSTRFPIRGLSTIAALLVVCLASGAAARAQPRAVRELADPDPTLQDVEQRRGPFALGPFAVPAQSFTVVLAGKRLPGATGRDAEALASLEIRDAGGAVRHREEFAYRVERGSFAHSCSASAEPLSGNVAAGLLISTGCLPPAPGGGTTWEIFGIVNGELVRFGKPFTTNGKLLEFLATPVVGSGSAVQIEPDVLRFKVRTGSFHVTLPVRVDWMQGRLTAGARCFELTPQGLRAGACKLPVEAERIPVERMTSVRLFGEAEEGMRIPRHVVVRQDSRVEILAARVQPFWDEARDVIFFGVEDRDPWLEVRIDGQEGWIHTPEDFRAIGVPQAD